MEILHVQKSYKFEFLILSDIKFKRGLTYKFYFLKNIFNDLKNTVMVF